MSVIHKEENQVSIPLILCQSIEEVDVNTP